MYDAPEDHNHAGMLSHDLPATCSGGCGWLSNNCHCT